MEAQRALEKVEGVTSHTVSVSISLDSKRVYAFVSRPENLPKWAPGLCRSLRKSRGGWLLETPDGEVAFRFVAKNKLGVLDHYVGEFYVPFRVVPNAAGSEVLLTLFRQPGMSARGFAKDIRLVKRDLARLRRVMGR